MRCSFCGNELEEGVKYCPLCGTKVKGKDPEKHAEEANEANDDRCSDPNGYQYGCGQPVKRISGTKYIVFSILTTLCCCPPLGIASIIFASKIDALQRSGDYAGAKKASKTARTLMIIGLIVGLASVVVTGTNTFSKFDDMVNSGSYEIEEEELVEESESDAVVEEIPRSDVQKADGLGDTWSSFTVQINDTVLRFPCTISDVEETGLKMDDEYWGDAAIVEAGDYELVFFSDDDLCSLMFMSVNNSATDKKVSECPLSGICVSDFDVKDGKVTVIFPGDVRVGDNISEVEAKWGAATEVTEGSSFDSYAWYGEAFKTYCMINVDPETGIITNIDLDGQYLE